MNTSLRSSSSPRAPHLPRAVARALTFAVAVAALVALPGAALAAPQWVDRPMTLPRLVFAGDVGLGIGHQGFGAGSNAGLGLNLEGAFGITDRIEVGLRTGLRPGDLGFRSAAGDVYARALWTETFWTGADTLANPEARVRGVLLQTDVVELGLDGRLVLPIERGTRAGVVLGVPLAFHVGRSLRIDTGAYLPIGFYDPVVAGLSVPGYFWFQINERLWLGPMAAIRFFNRGYLLQDDATLLAGFGLGYQFTNWLDLKTQMFWPQINVRDGFEQVGAGVGLQMRVE